MEFTEAEAKAKVGRGVHVRDDSLWRVHLTQGTQGEVVGAQLDHGDEESGQASSWAVCLKFVLVRDHSVSVLLRDVGKEQYAICFEELPAAREPEQGDSLSVRRNAVVWGRAHNRGQ